MLNTLTKTQPDWHHPLNENFEILEDKMKFTADFLFDGVEGVYIVTLRNIPQETTDGLPHTLPDFFSVVGRMPNDYIEEATFRVGAVDFSPKYAWFESGDVTTIMFDRLEQTCFFRSGGGGGNSPAAYAGTAYTGFSYVG